MLERGERVPEFEVTTIDAVSVSYGDLWQKKNLALVCLPEDDSPDAASYIQALRDSLPALELHDAIVIVTTMHVAGMPSPGCLVADRWGEIQWVAPTEEIADLPSPGQIAAWLGYVEIQCPECEGEVH